MDNITKKVGSNIRIYREKVNLSQGGLARLLGVDPSYISTLEKGLRNPSIASLSKIAKVLDVSLALLVEQSKFENKDPMPYVKGLINLKEKDWANKRWYHQRFDGSPYLMHMIGEAELVTDRDKKHGLYFDQHFCFYDDGKADWYIDMLEIERVTNRLIELAKKDMSFSKKLMKDYESFDQEFYAECLKIGRTNLSALSDTELILVHDNYLGKILRRNSSSSIIDGFALGSDKMLEERLQAAYEKSAVAKSMKFSDAFSILTAPPHTSFVRDAELKLFKLILAIRHQPEDKKNLIKEYQAKYFWIRNNYVDSYVLTVQYFEEEIARIESSGLDIEREIKRIEEQPDENERKKKDLLEKLKLDDEVLVLLIITEDFTQWQDERKKATMFTAHYAGLILDEISRRVNIPAMLIKYMSPREVSKIFIDTPPAYVLKERQKECVCYWDQSGHEILIGSVVSKLHLDLLGENQVDDIQDFRGMAASLGKAQGRVKILKSAKEIDRVEQGDVLVTVMTRPDYVPAMKKAAAIITDEGGITSHAAIVSRELKIPCVIGTKIATQVLKDGYLVEVNANHGMVRILSK